jgi:hypothetical protein
MMMTSAPTIRPNNRAKNVTTSGLRDVTRDHALSGANAWALDMGFLDDAGHQQAD